MLVEAVKICIVPILRGYVGVLIRSYRSPPNCLSENILREEELFSNDFTI